MKIYTSHIREWEISKNSTLNDRRALNEEYKVKLTMYEVNITLALHAM